MYAYKYPHPAVTADCIVFARENGKTRVLLIKRRNEPCKDMWALPGGFMNIDESAEEAAARELKEETGIDAGRVIQVGAYSKVDRDPRERVITIAFYTIIDKIRKAVGQDDAKQAEWFAIDNLPELAFDHSEILSDAIGMLNREP
ncbi:MAG: NUDIX hydrolase [Prevotella sp.]|uniref:NUDIX hydrolase n=1 Tax=Prevotella sp. TaxID=59823 RepID=UPI002A2C4A82|nr:NUDIX hydrolase [Prevotella sp.]MDD7317376.1 NUDIX hydrolase [Prevotellaceae bacterium]MDY4019474.1 NUDIX hydrolase [Prevotella sp.]